MVPSLCLRTTQMRFGIDIRVWPLWCVCAVYCIGRVVSVRNIRNVPRVQTLECVSWNSTSAFSLKSPTKINAEHFCFDTGHVPASYVSPSESVHSSPTYSIWPRFEADLSISEAPCQQQDRSQLCADENEIPLFILEQTNSQYECHCSGGFYRSRNSERCQVCPFGKFCPAYTDTAFVCPQHSELAIQPQRGGDTHCIADAGYRVQAVHRDIGSVLLALRSSATQLFYTVVPCAEPCFEIIRCGSEDLLDAKYAPGWKAIGGSFANGCILCPQHHYCVLGEMLPCSSNSYTNGTGHDDPEDCKCQAGFSKAGTHECNTVSDNSKYTRDCLSNVDQLCGGVLLDCPNGRLCENRLMQTACPLGEFVDHDRGLCSTCPVGFYCKYGIMLPCPSGATTTITHASEAESCFCAAPFHRTNVSGLLSEFICTLTNPFATVGSSTGVWSSQYLQIMPPTPTSPSTRPFDSTTPPPPQAPPGPLLP